MQSKPTSNFGKLMDYVRRPEYLSANIAEYAIGRSPYKHWHKAAWAGLSGQRRLDYIDLTENPALGLLLGFALDPLTYLPFGAISKGVKATKLPAAISRISMAAGEKWPTLQKAGVLARYAFIDPAAKLKFISGWDDAVNALKAGGLADDILKRVKTTGVIDDAARMAAKQINQLDNLEKVAEISRAVSEGAKIPARLTSLKASMIDEYVDMTKWFAELEAKHPEKAAAIIDLFEKSLPKRIVQGKKVVWGMGDDFIDALKRVGVTQDEIDNVLRGVSRPVFGLTDEQYKMMGAIDETVKHLREIPDHYKMPEFQELMDLAMGKLAPEARELYKRANYVQSRLVQAALKRRILDTAMLDNFARDLGLNYIPHLSIKQNYRRLHKILVTRNKNNFGELLELCRKYEGKILTDDVIKELTKSTSGDDLIKILNVKNAGELRKAGVPQDAVNQFIRIRDSMTQLRRIEGGLTDIGKKLVDIGVDKKLFETNLPKLIFEQELRLRSSFMYQSHIRGLLKQYRGTNLVRAAEDVADIGAELATGNFKRITDKMVGDFLVHKDLATAFENCIKITTGQSKDFQKFVRMYDKGLGMWKYGTLIPFGKFHIRNLVSEMLLNNIAGMWLTDTAYVKAAKFLSAVKSGDRAAKIKYLDMIRDGTIRTGFFASEIGASRKIITPAWKRVTGLKAMESLGEFTEDFPRIAMRFWLEKKGDKFIKKMGFNSAVEMVRKFHPTYDKFTPFERGIMRRIFPFYSWSRFNLPLHAEMFVQNPKHYARVERTRHAITKLRGGQLPDDIDPEWIREGYVIGWSKKPGKRTYIVLRGWLPHADLGELLAKRGMQDLIVRQLTPVKTLGEVFWGYDLFKKRKLPAYPGEKTTVLGAKVPSRYAHILTPIRIYQEVNRFFFGSNDNYWDRVVYHLFGRAYEIDENKARRRLKYDIGKAIGELEFGIKRAKKNGDLSTARTLEKQKKKLERAAKWL